MMDFPLHVCFNCGSDLVYPVTWEEEGKRAWWISLRCPACESRREGVFSQRTVEDLDDELDRGTAILTRDLAKLTRSNMSEESRRFVRALREDLINADDFA